VCTENILKGFFLLTICIEYKVIEMVLTVKLSIDEDHPLIPADGLEGFKDHFPFEVKAFFNSCFDDMVVRSVEAEIHE